MHEFNNLSELISALQGLKERLDEPVPAPLPEQDSRVGEAMAARADTDNRRAWQERRQNAGEELAELLPSVIEALSEVHRIMPDEIDIYRMIKDANSRRFADIAKHIASNLPKFS